jgi:hypothetical protein
MFQDKISQDTVNSTLDKLKADIGKRHGDWYLRKVIYFSGVKSIIEDMRRIGGENARGADALNKLSSNNIVRDLVDHFGDDMADDVVHGFLRECESLTNLLCSIIREHRT